MWKRVCLRWILIVYSFACWTVCLVTTPRLNFTLIWFFKMFLVCQNKFSAVLVRFWLGWLRRSSLCWLRLHFLCLFVQKLDPFPLIMLPVEKLLVVNEFCTVGVHQLFTESLVLQQLQEKEALWVPESKTKCWKVQGKKVHFQISACYHAQNHLFIFTNWTRWL